MVNPILKFLSSITKQGLIIPVYHAISNSSPAHLKHLYGVRTVKEFENDLDYLLMHYKPLDINDFLNHLKEGKEFRKKGFLLTFDDGLREVFEVVRPILLSKGIPAIVFLNSGFVDNRDIFFRYKASILLENLKLMGDSSSTRKEIKKVLNLDGSDYESIRKSILGLGYEDSGKFEILARLLEVDFIKYLKDTKPYLDSDQIKTMIKEGFIFGGHSIDHPFYNNLTHDLQLKQTFESVKTVEERFAMDSGLFAFPFTDFGITKTFFEDIYSCKTPKIYASFGTAGLKKDTYAQHFQRIPVENYSRSLSSTVLFEYLYYLLKVLFGKNKIVRK